MRSGELFDVRQGTVFFVDLEVKPGEGLVKTRPHARADAGQPGVAGPDLEQLAGGDRLQAASRLLCLSLHHLHVKDIAVDVALRVRSETRRGVVAVGNVCFAKPVFREDR